ncbi:MAG: hypothetical protein DWQ19_12820 [Crenarchaeota archaeon]|nr:MAG: hypothetical protein DWQ19_12820 [Thermoproteota archaeon]
MIELRLTADPNALDVYRKGKRIGSLQWHKERPARYVPETHTDISITEMQILINRWKQCRRAS